MSATGENLLCLLDNSEETVVREAGWYRQLVTAVSELLNNDFPGLVNVLYRVDVSEEKLKTLLNENRGIDAAEIISSLILERQLQKIKNRKEFSFPASDIGEDEKW